MSDTMTTNPKGITKFLKWGKDQRVTVFTTEKVAKYYPKVGTEINLHKSQAEKWKNKGWATEEAPEGSKATKAKK
jgi:hypothetical protein